MEVFIPCKYGGTFCWYNNMQVVIPDENLTPIKAERWKPKAQESYWFISGTGDASHTYWDEFGLDEKRWNAYNVFRTEEEAKAEAEATLADRKARLDK